MVQQFESKSLINFEYPLGQRNQAEVFILLE